MASEVFSADSLESETKPEKSTRRTKNWLQWSIAYSAVRLHNSRHSSRFTLYDLNAKGDPVKLGFLVPQSEKDLESPCEESHLQQGADEVLFYGINSKAECLLIRVSRGPNQVSEAWLYLKLANGKTYRLSESAGYQQSFDGKCTIFSCGNLQLHYLSPMRRWRIFYCGMLKEVSDEKKEELVFVKFVLLFKASSNAYDLTVDTNPKEFTNALSRAEWKSPLSPPLDELSDALNCYAQSGIINGTISVNDGPDYEIYLFGEKVRNISKTGNYDGVNFINVMGNLPKHGLSFHMGKGTIPGIISDLHYGFVVTPEGNLTPIEQLDLSMDKPNTKDSGSAVKAIFRAGRPYNFQGSIIHDPLIFNSNHGWTGSFEVSFIEFTESKRKGYGLIISGENLKGRVAQIISTPIPSFPKDVPLIVKFSDEISHFGDISGGKGSSLGKLTDLSLKEKSFTVPKGIVVTTAAYSEFLTEEIITAIKKMENVVYGTVKGDPKEACKLVCSIVEKAPMSQRIRDGISKHLKEVFDDDLNKYKFAVRSSATGEDTAAMSSAGQMDTFLGIQGLEEIYTAVKKCWASQFGYIAVEYKRRNGQILNSPMAVVVQEMVASEISGVLFTCDPVTNNPSVITITANYGLGETVVSGSVEPDTITLKRHPDGSVEFDSVAVGSKLQRIVMKDSGGTRTEDISEASRLDSCLSKDMSERLGTLGLKIEEYYKSPRDIEWGISNSSIYILQSRPVTSIAAETEYEMIHELDAAVRSENDSFTIANVGEALPGASSSLGMELLYKYVEILMRKQAIKMGFGDFMMQSPYFMSSFLTFSNHLVSSIEIITQFGFDSPLAKGFMISVFGRILDEPELINYLKEKISACTLPPPKPSLTSALQLYKTMYFHDQGFDNIRKQTFNYHRKFMQMQKAEDTFKALMDSCSDFDETGVYHWTASEVSSNWNMNIFQILSDAHGTADTDVYSDFARLLATSSNVESANVPQALQDVANEIIESVEGENFKSMPVDEALKWLESSSSPAGQKFQQFIKRHGHRCLRELDVFTRTWEMDPKSLVKMLQSLTASGVSSNKKGQDDDFEKLISELHVQLGFLYKLKLKHTLPNCRRGVRGRENTKSCLVKCMDHWRQGFRRCAKQMVSEGRIPDEDLIFFMTLDEIKDLLETRSPGIISRANFRKRIWPKLDSYIFAEIIRGIPKPINDETESAENYEHVADLTLKGTPVSQGVAKGYVRIASTLEEAAFLKKGEILITYSTDIGWSPYFPIVSGLVTEIGGLISHGAVVSREYGLPCVVAVKGATKRFQTGDYVLLDGKKGIIQRLPKPEE